MIYKVVLQLEQQYGALSADPNSVATYQQYSDAIAEGQASLLSRLMS